MNVWQMQQAKSRFSELIMRARTEGPQTVTVHGERAAVIISAADYDRLAAPLQSLVDAIRSGPEWPEAAYEFINDRSRDLPRDIAL